jgi:hypothetical protein
VTTDPSRQPVRGSERAAARDEAHVGASAPGWRRTASDVARATLLGPFAIAFAVYLAAFLVMRPATAGDEQHYLLAAQSIALDGDIDLSNDYASRERTLAVTNHFPQEPQAFRYTSSEAVVPFHPLGLSFLLAPAVALGGITLARLSMILIAALVADQLYRLLAQLGVARPRHRWLAWGAVALSLPLLVFSNQFYPELPGALLVLVSLRVVATGEPGPRAILGAALAGAALPWLHIRYLPVAAFLLVALIYAACPARDGSGRHRRLVRRMWGHTRRCLRALATSRRSVGLSIALPFAVSIAGLAGVFEALYGSPLPDAPYRPLGVGGPGSAGSTFWYEYLLAYFLHPADGWIPYAPVHWLGIAAIGCAVWKLGRPAVVVVAAIAVYLVIVASAGLAPGFGFPARFLVIFVPLVAIPLAVALESLRDARLVYFPLAIASLVIAAAAVLEHERLYPLQIGPHYPARVFGVRSIQTMFPDTRPVAVPTSAVVHPGDFGPQVGRLQNGLVVASEANGDAPGFVLFGPYAALPAGLYAAKFSLAARVRGDETVARIEVTTPPERVLAQRQVGPNDVGRGSILTELVLRFGTPGGVPIDARVFFEGRGTLVAGPIELSPEPGTAQSAETLPDWPLAFLWVAGTALVARLFVRAMRATQR